MKIWRQENEFLKKIAKISIFEFFLPSSDISPIKKTLVWRDVGGEPVMIPFENFNLETLDL
jgi:hypothetical protein